MTAATAACTSATAVSSPGENRIVRRTSALCAFIARMT